MTELELEGLNCPNCAAKIEESLKHNEFLSDVNFSFATKKLTVNSSFNQNELKKFIQKEVDKIEEGVKVELNRASLSEHQLPDIQTLLRKQGLTLVGSLLFFSLFFIPYPPTGNTIIYITAYLFVGGDILLKALKDILKGRLFDENFLMSVATIGAFVLGEWNEAIAVMLFYKIGEGFQDFAVDKSRRSIKSLLNIKAEFANRVEKGKTIRVKPEDLSIGDRILVRNGEKVPVDGIIIEGRSGFDTSALTGESIPRSAGPEEKILSGFINKEAPVTIKVTEKYSNSAVARILHMVENATSKKARTEQFITKFARIYTPIVVTSALIMAFIPPLLSLGPLSVWISRALIFLVISCPCALVLSVPLGYFGGLGMASRKGILIKGGNYLEALNNIDTFVFDKTGTLTKGNFSVETYSTPRTLELAAHLEQQSNHPIAKSIIKAFGESPGLHEVRDIVEIPGSGLSGYYRGNRLLAGNAKLMQTESIEVPQEAVDKRGTVIHVAYKGDYVGNIIIKDEIKDSSRGLIRKLKILGATSIIMLTGDRESVARSVADELELDNYSSELLPEDKLTIVEDLIANGKKVLFAGDGINDAPVLARAHIGAAMGGLGSDAAIEAADMVIMTDEPSKLIQALFTAHKTKKIVLQNIIFTLTVKIFFLALGAFGIATMYEAIFADVGVALMAVVNSMRILKD